MPMYQAPEFKVLNDSIKALDSVYTDKDEKRLTAIKRIQTIAKDTDKVSQNILMGILSLTFDDIASEYRFYKPEGLGFFFKTGSGLYSLLKNILDLNSQTEIDKHHKLVYNAALHAYLTSQQVIDTELLKLIESHLQKTLAECKPEIDALANRHLSAEIVKENFAKIPEKYAALKKSKNQTAGREEFVALIKTVDKKLSLSDEAVSNYSFNNTIRHALIVYIMEEIEIARYFSAT